MKRQRAVRVLALLSAMVIPQLLLLGCSSGQTTVTSCPDGGDAGCTTVPVVSGGGW